MYRLMTRTCPSDLFTDFTVHLRCTVCRGDVEPQWIAGCLYGFYGVKAYTPIYRERKKQSRLSVLARVDGIKNP